MTPKRIEAALVVRCDERAAPRWAGGDEALLDLAVLLARVCGIARA